MGNQEKELENYKIVLSEIFKGVQKGDVDEGLSLAYFYGANLPSSDSDLHLIVIETLVRQSASLGSSEAQEYLQNIWPELKKVLAKGLVRKGMSSSEVL